MIIRVAFIPKASAKSSSIATPLRIMRRPRRQGWVTHVRPVTEGVHLVVA